MWVTVSSAYPNSGTEDPSAPKDSGSCLHHLTLNRGRDTSRPSFLSPLHSWNSPPSDTLKMSPVLQLCTLKLSSTNSLCKRNSFAFLSPRCASFPATEKKNMCKELWSSLTTGNTRAEKKDVQLEQQFQKTGVFQFISVVNATTEAWKSCKSRIGAELKAANSRLLRHQFDLSSHPRLQLCSSLLCVTPSFICSAPSNIISWDSTGS